VVETEIKASAITLCGRVLDFTNHIPLKIKDWKALKKQGILAKDVESGDVDSMAAMLAYVVQKADPTITQADVDELEMEDPNLLALIKALSRKAGHQALDRPS